MQQVLKANIFQLQSKSYAILFVDQRFAVNKFSCILSSNLDIRLEQSENENLAPRYGFKNVKYDDLYPFFQVDRYEPEAQW